MGLDGPLVDSADSKDTLFGRGCPTGLRLKLILVDHGYDIQKNRGFPVPDPDEVVEHLGFPGVGDGPVIIETITDHRPRAPALQPARNRLLIINIAKAIFLVCIMRVLREERRSVEFDSLPPRSIVLPARNLPKKHQVGVQVNFVTTDHWLLVPSHWPLSLVPAPELS
jgi:hypothetical protein